MRLNRSKLAVVAGPCVIEGRQFIIDSVESLCEIFCKAGVEFVFKSSFDKANRSSLSGFRGPGIDEGLSILQEVKQKFNVMVTTDIHEPWQAKYVAEVVDIIQIPAFLCRQTDLIAAASATGKPVNFKKGQFLSAYDMKCVVQKARMSAQENGVSNELFFVTERGNCFGYDDHIVDMRNLRVLKSETQCPVIIDASHPLISRSGGDLVRAGQQQFAIDLASAAVATGHVSGVFVETHPEPSKALCDPDIQVSFSELRKLIVRVKAIDDCVKSLPR